MKTTLFLSGLTAALLAGAARARELPPLWSHPGGPTVPPAVAPWQPGGAVAPPAGPVNGGTHVPPNGTPPNGGSPNGTAEGDGNGRSSDERSTPGKSSWLTYPRPAACCGPVGGHGPIGYEIYFRTGCSYPFGGFLASQLKPGWVFEGGLRSLFFNPALDAAWVITGSISNVNYNSTTRDTAILRNFVQTVDGQEQTIPEFPVTPGGLNQTFVNLAFGRELYLWGDAKQAEVAPTWRVGWDFGGRWGSEKLVLREIRHRTDVIGGLFTALHTDLEFPCSCCIYHVGARFEYGYVWSDVLQSHNNADLNTINLLITAGVRY
jgi:hypothetical protein